MKLYISAAGYCYGKYLNYDGFNGCYWSSTPGTRHAYNVSRLDFTCGEVEYYYHDDRALGFSIRNIKLN